MDIDAAHTTHVLRAYTSVLNRVAQNFKVDELGGYSLNAGTGSLVATVRHPETGETASARIRISTSSESPTSGFEIRIGSKAIEVRDALHLDRILPDDPKQFAKTFLRAIAEGKQGHAGRVTEERNDKGPPQVGG